VIGLVGLPVGARRWDGYLVVDAEMGEGGSDGVGVGRGVDEVLVHVVRTLLLLAEYRLEIVLREPVARHDR